MLFLFELIIRRLHFKPVLKAVTLFPNLEFTDNKTTGAVSHLLPEKMPDTCGRDMEPPRALHEAVREHSILGGV